MARADLKIDEQQRLQANRIIMNAYHEAFEQHKDDIINSKNYVPPSLPCEPDLERRLQKSLTLTKAVYQQVKETRRKLAHKDYRQICAFCGRVFDLMGDQKNKHRYKFTLPRDKLPRAAIVFPEAYQQGLIKGGEGYPDKNDPSRNYWFTCRCCFHKPIDEDMNPDSV